MASLTASGLGSGLDIGGLVTQLVTAETEPAAARLRTEEVGVQARISGLGFLKSALSGLKGALEGIAAPEDFDGSTTSSGDRDVFTASASADTAPGVFDVEVVRLAQTHKLRSAGFADADAEVGTGTLTIHVGSESFSVTLDDSSKTLAGVRDAINGAADNAGVSARIVNVDDGVGGTESRLVLSGTETGEANAIKVVVDDDDLTDTDGLGLSRLAYDPAALPPVNNLVQLQAAQDAQIKIDQQAVTRSSNTITDAIEGITITLVSESVPGETAALTVAADSSIANSRIRGFVNAYNGVVDALSQVSNFDSETGETGSLIGDPMVRSLQRSLQRVLGDQVGATGATYTTLAEIGITTGQDGRLSIDQTELDAAMADDRDAVVGLFSNTDSYAERLDAVVEGYVAFEGLIDTRTSALEDRIESIANRRAALERRALALDSRLLAQFSAMDALVGQLRSTGDFLAQQLSSLQAITTSRVSDN